LENENLAIVRYFTPISFTNENQKSFETNIA